MSTLDPKELSRPNHQNKHPEPSETRKQNGSSNEGRFTRKPAPNQTHKRKGLNINKNSQIELMQSNVLSSLKSDLQHMQSQMVKLNTEQETKPILYAKTIASTNTDGQISTPSTYKDRNSEGLANDGGSQQTHLETVKKALRSPTSKQSPKLLHKQPPQPPKQDEKFNQKVRQFHYQQQLRYKNSIIQELQRKLSTLQQDHENQISQLLIQKIELERNARIKIQQLTDDKNKLINSSIISTYKQQQLVKLKQELSQITTQLHASKLEKLELKKTHEDTIFKLESEIYSLKLALSQHTSQNLKDKGKAALTQELISKKNHCIKKMQQDNILLSTEIKKLSESKDCPKCQDISHRCNLLTEQNQQLRTSINTFLKQFKKQTQESTKILNPEYEHELEKKNTLIQTLSTKVKHIETLAIELHSLDRKHRASEHLLQETNEELLKIKLGILNSFYK